MSDSPTPYRPRCMNLTCKSMMVYGENFQSDPEFQAGMVEFQCLKTFRNLGPDGEELSLEQCSDPERGCYQEC
jgi:hypothetical protein